jgi:hypothetical protein
MNPLADCGLPRFFAISDASTRFPMVRPPAGEAVRLHGRSLAGMQKEAVVCTSMGGIWRLASDEGAYLNGLDEAPCPLAFMTTGMVPHPQSVFEGLAPADPQAEPLVARGEMTPFTEEVTSHSGSSYASEQHRLLHLRGVCTVRPDGVKIVEQHLYNPHGSIFRLLSDEAPGHGGGGRAPDAATYVSAGIGFCFMTQFGRFAKITGKTLDSYRIVQDTHFGIGRAKPVETHVYLDTPEDEAFAREVLDMGERTCFLHALCRTELTTNVRVVRSDMTDARTN